MPKESERRFLLAGLPPGEALSHTTIRQAYWQLGNGWSLRIRREGPQDGETKNSVTIKSPRVGVSREEFDLGAGSLPDAYAESLYKAGSKHVVVKTRHSFVIDDEVWDIDQFHWENEGLFIAELEMEDAEALAARPVPTWAIREVTYDLQYSNDQLALRPYKTW